jgi:hypothetical protein
MVVEDAFGVPIPDNNARSIATPGQLVDYLVSQLPLADHSTCREQRAFHALRRAGIQVLQQPRTAFTTTTRWAELLPEDRRRHAWRVLRHAVGASKWPTLLPWTRYPIGQKTLGDTARYLAAYVPSAWQVEGWTRGDIEVVVRRLMAEELFIKQFNWDDEFVRDLKCD